MLEEFIKGRGMTTAIGLEDYVAKEFAQIPEVEFVLSKRNGEGIKFWTVVDDFEDALFTNIYAHEARLRQSFRETRLDFNVITLKGQPLGEVANPAYVIWRRS